MAGCVDWSWMKSCTGCGHALDPWTWCTLQDVCVALRWMYGRAWAIGSELDGYTFILKHVYICPKWRYNWALTGRLGSCLCPFKWAPFQFLHIKVCENLSLIKVRSVLWPWMGLGWRRTQDFEPQWGWDLGPRWSTSFISLHHSFFTFVPHVDMPGPSTLAGARGLVLPGISAVLYLIPICVSCYISPIT